MAAELALSVVLAGFVALIIIDCSKALFRHQEHKYDQASKNRLLKEIAGHDSDTTSL